MSSWPLFTAFPSTPLSFPYPFSSLSPSTPLSLSLLLPLSLPPSPSSSLSLFLSSSPSLLPSSLPSSSLLLSSPSPSLPPSLSLLSSSLQTNSGTGADYQRSEDVIRLLQSTQQNIEQQYAVLHCTGFIRYMS